MLMNLDDRLRAIAVGHTSGFWSTTRTTDWTTGTGTTWEDVQTLAITPGHNAKVLVCCTFSWSVNDTNRVEFRLINKDTSEIFAYNVHQITYNVDHAKLRPGCLVGITQIAGGQADTIALQHYKSTAAGTTTVDCNPYTLYMQATIQGKV